MKLSAILLIAVAITAVSAVPRRHRPNRNHENNSNHEVNKNYEDNRNYEDNSHNANKQINQGIGSVGSSSGGGLLGGLLGGGVLSKNQNTNNVKQNAQIN